MARNLGTKPKRAKKSNFGNILAVLIVAAVFLATGFGIWVLLLKPSPKSTYIPTDQCIASADGHQVSITLDQAKNVSIITGEALNRGLGTKAATIALATAYQESYLINVDYGDADSLGLFQQRPSQGWGSEKQIMDPWYSSGRFYEELVKFRGWQNGDITEYAQKVQRSAYPDAYRKHEANAIALAKVFTGQAGAGLSCVNNSGVAGNPDALVEVLQRSFGNKIAIEVTKAADNRHQIKVKSPDLKTAYAVTAIGMGTIGQSGIDQVRVAGQSWSKQQDRVANWSSPTQVSDQPYLVEFELAG